MDKQNNPKNGSVETAQKLLTHINELENLTQALLKEKAQKKKEEQENKNTIQAERIKQQALEDTKTKEKALIGTEALAKLSDLKKDGAFNSAAKLLIENNVKGEVELYRKVSSLPEDALSNEGRSVVHRFVLLGDGQLLFERSEAPRCWAEAIMLASQHNNKRRRSLSRPEDFNDIPYRSLKEFNELLHSDKLLCNFELQLKELVEKLQKRRILLSGYWKSGASVDP